jgi:hypothetical protein
MLCAVDSAVLTTARRRRFCLHLLGPTARCDYQSLRPRAAGGNKKGAKRDANEKPAAKEPSKKAKKEAENAAPADDVEMKEAEDAIVGSGRQAAQVCFAEYPGFFMFS